MIKNLSIKSKTEVLDIFSFGQVALAAVAKNLCCLTVPAFLCLRKLPRRQHWVWTVAQVSCASAVPTLLP